MTAIAMAAKKKQRHKPATARPRAPKRLDKEGVQQRWQKAMDKCQSRQEATDKGISYAALAQALGVSRQRIYNQLVGPAPISWELYEQLSQCIRLPAQPPKALPAPRTYESLKGQLLEHQREIQRKVDSGEYVRVPSILLKDPEHIAAWKRIVEAHNGRKSQAIRTLIMNHQS